VGREREALRDAERVCVDRPSAEHQTRGLGSRGDDAAPVARRMWKTASERAEAVSMGYVMVVNDEVGRAVEAVEALVAADRGRRREGPVGGSGR